MKQLSATEASRRFSELLDEVEHGGESYLVVRHGRVVATIGPAERQTGKALRDVLRTHRPDTAWAEELKELRHGLEPVTDPWLGRFSIPPSWLTPNAGAALWPLRSKTATT